MPVSNPPFPYWNAGNRGVYVYSDGEKTGSVGKGRDMTVYAAHGGVNPLIESYGGYLNLIAGYAYNTTADGANSVGGAVIIRGPDGGDVAGDSTTSHGGYVYFYAGNGGHASGIGSYSYGGKFLFQAGDAYSEQSYAFAGSFVVRAGSAKNAVSYANYGGDIAFNAGNAGYGSYANGGGSVNIGGGNINGVNSSDEAGDVKIYGGGATNYGRAGDVNIQLRNGVTRNGLFIISNIPIIAPAVSGAVWNNLGVLTIVP